jgi:hypothetical protein
MPGRPVEAWAMECGVIESLAPKSNLALHEPITNLRCEQDAILEEGQVNAILLR